MGTLNLNSQFLWLRIVVVRSCFSTGVILSSYINTCLGDGLAFINFSSNNFCSSSFSEKLLFMV